MSFDPELFQIYKPVGKTPLEIVEELRGKGLTGKMAYSGRLDPMAHGYLLLLRGSKLSQMSTFNAKNKTYRVKILIGINTDSTDRLGIPESAVGGSGGSGGSSNSYDLDKIINAIKSYSDKVYDQEFHIYSSMPVVDPDTGKKKPLWEITKLGKVSRVIIPSKKVHIYNIDHVNVYHLGRDTVRENVQSALLSITLPKGFRVDLIKEKWNKILERGAEAFNIIEFDAQVSSGTFIRQLVKDISADCGVPMIVYDLYRYPFDL